MSPCAEIDIANRVHGEIRNGLTNLSQSTINKTISELIESDCIEVVGKRHRPRVLKKKGRKPQGKKQRITGGRPALLIDLSFKGLVHYLTDLSDKDQILNTIKRYGAKTEFPIFIEFEELERIYGEKIFKWLKIVVGLLRDHGTAWEHDSSDRLTFPPRYRVKWIELEWKREFSKYMFWLMDEERLKQENTRQRLPPRTYQLMIEMANREIERLREAIFEWEYCKDSFYRDSREL